MGKTRRGGKHPQDVKLLWRVGGPIWMRKASVSNALLTDYGVCCMRLQKLRSKNGGPTVDGVENLPTVDRVEK